MDKDYTNNENLDANKKNSLEFEKIMDNAAVKKDGYWDKGNLFVKLILIVLFLFIVIASGYLWYKTR